MEKLGVNSFLGNSTSEINYFIEGVNGNFLFGSGKGLGGKEFDFIKAKGGLSKVFNLSPSDLNSMSELFIKFGASEVRIDNFSIDSYPTTQYGVDFIHPQVKLLQTDQISHFLLRQRERNILFMDPEIRFDNQQFQSPYDTVLLGQSLLHEVEKIDYCACFFPVRGNHFFALLPGLLERKVEQMQRI